MNKPGKSSLFKATLLSALLASAFGAHAAGLGKLSVYSAIGQPLNAEIALTATADELISLTAKLGAQEAFKEAGVEYMPALAGVRFNVVKQPNNQAVLKLTTDRPLNEPFLHFLVELNWSAGRMVREYTFLLDPPEMLQAAKPASVVAPVAPALTPAAPPLAQPAPAPRPAAAPAEPVAARPLPAASPKPAATPKPAAVQPPGDSEVRVKPGDTLSKIAREHKPESVSLDQMLVALFNNNREAFDGSNMNRLRAGKILRLPEETEVARVDAGEARQMVVSQAADFNAYRRRLAAAAVAAPATEAAPQQQAAGKIKPQVEEKAPAPVARDKLEVSRTEAAKTGKAAGKGSLEEDLIARDKALREAADRIAELEKNLDNLRKLVELKSQAGLQAQQQAQAVAPKPVPEAKPEPVKPLQEPAKPVEPPKAIESAKVLEPPKSDEPKSAAPPAAEEKPVEPAAAPQVEPAKPAEPAPPPKPAPKKPAPPPPPPPPEPSFVEDNPEIVFGGGALLAILLGYFGFKTWKRKREEQAEFAEEPSVSASELASTSGAIFGAASESVDNGEVSIQGDFSEGGVLTTEESVDPVAEADVYMAYGRDSQAEEILLEGLKSDPTRTAIHLKLLELYATRKSIEPFENVAGQLHALTGGQGSDWDKAASLAAGLGIAGGLFAAAAQAESPMPAAQEEIEAQPVAEQAATVISHVDEFAATPAASEPAPAAPAPEEAASLDFDLDLGTTSRPAVAMAEPQAAPAAAEEAMSLDFDFDLGTPEPAAPEAAAVAEPAVAESAPVAENMIDFALDIGSAPVETSVEPAVEEASAVADANEIDFDLDLGSSEVPADEIAATVESEEPEPTAVETPAPAGGLGDLKIDFDLDLGSGGVAAAPADEPSPAAAEGDLGAALADIDLDLELPAVETAAAPQAEAVPEVELPEVVMPAAEADMADAAGGVDFDLALDVGAPEATVPVAAEAEPAMDLADLDLGEPAAAAVAEPEPLAELPDIELGEAATAAEAVEAAPEIDDPEVATKLELAQAYEEMGDREGARELLNEVLNEGSPAQQELARERLAQLEV